jgi:hypothetical protein
MLPFQNESTGKVNYKEMIEYIREFNYDAATNSHNRPNTQSLSSSSHSDIIHQ